MEVCDQRAWGGGRAGELRAGGQGGEALILEMKYFLLIIQGGEMPEGGGDVQYCKRWL